MCGILLGISVLVASEELKIEQIHDMTGSDVIQNNAVTALKWHQGLLSLHFIRIQKLLVCVRL